MLSHTKFAFFKCCTNSLIATNGKKEALESESSHKEKK